jgi:spermidine synthase
LEVAQSLKEVGFDEMDDLLATYAGVGTDLREWLEGAEINRDRNLRLQYLAGMGLNSRREWSNIIYLQIATHRRFSEKLFVGSEHRKQALRARME